MWWRFLWNEGGEQAFVVAVYCGCGVFLEGALQLCHIHTMLWQPPTLFLHLHNIKHSATELMLGLPNSSPITLWHPTKNINTTTPPNQGIPDKKPKCEEMMRMAQGTLRDDKNAISSHFASVRGGFSGKIVTDSNPSTLLYPNPSQMTNAHIMQQCRTQCNVNFCDLVHINDHPMSFNHCNHMHSPHSAACVWWRQVLLWVLMVLVL